MAGVEEKSTSWQGRFRGLLGTTRDPFKEEELLKIKEVTALHKFAVERGLDPDCKLTEPLLEGILAFEYAKNDDERVQHYKQLVGAYQRLAALTYDKLEVNGRTLIDTKDLFYVTAIIPILGFLCLLGAIGLEAGDLVYAGEACAELAPQWNAVSCYTYSIGGPFLKPFFWGGLGASVWLARTLSDKAARQAFDSQRLKGHTTRIFLGAIIAVVVVTGGFSSEEIIGITDVTPSAVAFLSGLGVKAIYSGFETLIDSISDWFKRIKPKQNQSGN